MSNATLMGTNQVSEQDVFNVPAVPFTKTFHPIHHGDVIRSIQEAIGIVGMEVVILSCIQTCTNYPVKPSNALDPLLIIF